MEIEYRFRFDVPNSIVSYRDIVEDSSLEYRSIFKNFSKLSDAIQDSFDEITDKKQHLISNCMLEIDHTSIDEYLRGYKFSYKLVLVFQSNIKIKNLSSGMRKMLYDKIKQLPLDYLIPISFSIDFCDNTFYYMSEDLNNLDFKQKSKIDLDEYIDDNFKDSLTEFIISKVVKHVSTISLFFT